MCLLVHIVCAHIFVHICKYMREPLTTLYAYMFLMLVQRVLRFSKSTVTYWRLYKHWNFYPTWELCRFLIEKSKRLPLPPPPSPWERHWLKACISFLVHSNTPLFFKKKKNRSVFRFLAIIALFGAVITTLIVLSWPMAGFEFPDETEDPVDYLSLPRFFLVIIEVVILLVSCVQCLKHNFIKRTFVSAMK